MLVQAQDGRLFRVPDGTPEDEIRARLALVERTAPVQEEEQGILGRAGDLLVQGGRELAGAGAEGLATLSDLAFDDTTDSFEGILQDFAQSQRDKRSEIRGIKPLQEAEGFGDVLSSAASYLTQSVPEMGSIFAGAGVGAKIGTAFGPLGTLVGGLTGGTLVGIIPFLGRNTEEFKQTQGRAPDKGEALTLLGTSVVQSGLNTLITRLLPLKGQTLTAAMVKRAAGGTGIEGVTEGLQDTLQVLAANNFDPEALRDPDVQYRLTESFLAGAAIGGGLGLASGPFGVQRPTPQDNTALQQAASDFVGGRPPEAGPLQITDQTQRPELLTAPDARLPIEDQRPDAPLQITAQDTPPTDSRVEPVVRAERGDRAERTVTDSQGRTQTVVSTPEVGQATAEQRTLTGQQEPFLVGDADPSPPSADVQANQTNADMVQQVYREALDAGRDPLADLATPEITKRIEDAIAGEAEQDVVLAPTPLAQEAQNVSRLKNKELLEWAKQNAGRNENLDSVVNSDIPLTKKAQLIRRLLREMNVGRTTAAESETQAQQAGQPILRKAVEVGEDGRITRTATEGTVEATDPSSQARMGRRTDTEQGIALREELGPIVTPAFREMLRLRGGEASVRMGADGSPQITGVPGQLPGTQRYQGALNYLTGRLQDLEAKGAQGKKAAQAIKRQVMDDTTADANSIVGAFLAADAVVETLGGEGPKGGVDIMFLKNIEDGAKHGLKGYRGAQAVVQIAMDDSPTKIQQTASHEAFHFLQDFYAEYSPKDAKVLKSIYKMKDGKVNYKALPASIRRLWKKQAPDIHARALKGDLPVMESPSEFQAMTFEFYRAAQQAGDTAPLTGAFGNYFDFVSRFLPRLRNSLRGMGFQTAEDVFARAGRGETAARVEGKQLSDRNAAELEKSLDKLDGTEDSIRLSAERSMSDVNVSKIEPDFVGAKVPVTLTTRLTRKSFIDSRSLDSMEAQDVVRKLALAAYMGEAPQVIDAFADLEIGPGGDNAKRLFNLTRRLPGPDGPVDKDILATLSAERFAEKVGTAARAFTVGEFEKDTAIVAFEYPQSESGEYPSMSFALYPDGSISEAYTDAEDITAYRIDNEVFDFFPDFGKRSSTTKEATITSYADLMNDSDNENVWELAFNVEGDYSTQNDKDGRTALEIFGKSAASFRRILDTIKDKGYGMDAVVFAGTDGKKQKLYERMLENKSFISMFPELGTSSPIKVRSSQGTKIELKKVSPEDDEVVDAIFEDAETGELVDFDGRPVPDPRQLDLFDEASIRLDRVQDLSQMDLAPENDRVSSLFGLTDAMRRLSSLDILYNTRFNPALPDKDEKAGRDGKKRGTGRNVSEAARMLHNRALAVLNEPITSPNPETDEIIARTMAAEIVAARENNPDTNATDWYTQSVQAAIQAVAQIHPEVATDPEHRSAFSLALALTSQGIVVDRNSRLGLRAYEFWRDNGRFPEFGEGKAGAAIKKNFKNANVLLETFKSERFNIPFYDFLDTQFTVRELKERLESFGIKTGKGGVSLSGENQDTLVYGSFMFGPKIGQGFYQNLMGNFDPVTIDLWFMRTWGRMTGTLVGNESAYQKNLGELRTSMRNEGMEFDEELFGTDEQYTFDKITEANQIGEDFYKANKEAVDNGDVQKTPMMKAASMALVNGVQPKGTPRGGNERKWMRSVVKRAQDMLSEQGINLTSADMQAILWYPEKDLYAKLTSGGLEERLNQSYEDSFKEIIDGEAGLRTVDGGGRRADSTRESIDKADAKSRRGTRQPVSGEEASIRFSQPDYLTTDGMKAVIAPPNTDGVISGVANFVKRFTTSPGRGGLKRQFVDEFIHGLAPIARRELELSARTRGERRYLPFQEGAFKALEFAQQSSGRIQMIMTKGAPKLNPDGSVGILEGTRGLLDIFQPIGAKEKYAKFQMFVYAQRAQRLKNEGRENLMTDAQIAEGMRYGAENPEFQEVFKQYQNYNEGLMQFLEDTGSITEETKKKLIGTADYVPFYRVIEEEQYTEGFMGQIKRPSDVAHNGTSAFDNPDAQIKRVVQRLKGGEEKIGDLYENIFKNTEAIVSSGMRNNATARVVKMIKELKAEKFYEGMVAPSDISASEAAGNNNHFTYREKGKTKYFDVGQDGEIITALRSFTPTQTQGLFKTMQDIGRFFRNAITITPSFMIANLIRGDMAGVVSVDAPIRPMIDTVVGLKNALKDTETIQEMKTIAGFGGYNFGESSTDFAKKMKRFYRRHEGYDIVDTPQKLRDMFGHYFDKIGAVGEATELATREGIYRRLTEGGTSQADAAYEALNLINYSRRGNPQSLPAQAFASLIPLVPFLNARVQGLYRTGTAFGPEANAKHTALKGLGLFAASMGVYAVMSQEDEWEQEPLYRKLNYYIIYAGDRKFLIPKPFEIGAVFSTIPEVFLDGIRQKDGEYVQKAVTEILLNNFSFNPIPQAVKPLVEVATNYDFFRGRDIESLGVRGLPTEMRAYSTTTEFAKTIGQITSALGISPIEAEALVNGYTGSMGSMMLGGMDTLMELSGTIPNKPSGIFGDTIESVPARLLGLTRFVKDREADPANRYLSEFYELKREADEVVRGINRLREEGNYEEAMELRRENRGLIAVKKQLNRKYVQLNELNDQISGIKLSGASADEKKRRLDALINRRNRIVSDMARLKNRIRG